MFEEEFVACWQLQLLIPLSGEFIVVWFRQGTLCRVAVHSSERESFVSILEIPHCSFHHYISLSLILPLYILSLTL